MSNDRLEVRVVDCFIFRNNVEGDPEFLILRRSPNVMYPGNWRMVGGKINAGETAWQAAIRETREETGLTPLAMWTVPYVNLFYEWRHDRMNVIPVFLMQVDAALPVILDKEHDQFRWVPDSEADQLLRFPAQREGLAMAVKMVKNPRSVSSTLQIDLTRNVP